ncbi:WSC domain-containing protein 2 [Serendipita sp. 407]|nr:WSC domain-containing protein 2 [Serendipita sp. 407]
MSIVHSSCNTKSPFRSLITNFLCFPTAMISSSLVALVPFVLTANALLFEPPSATVSKRNHRRVADTVDRRGHTRRASGDQWVSLGCRTDLVVTRALPGAMTASDTMTNDACKAFCDQAGFSIAATEWSRECWCDNEFHYGEIAPAEECNYMCTGNGAEVCGGSVRMTVWTNGATVLGSYGSWTSQGCFVDTVAARIVPTYVSIDAPFTPQRCLDKCSSLGYSYAGLEYMHTVLMESTSQACLRPQSGNAMRCATVTFHTTAEPETGFFSTLPLLSHLRLYHPVIGPVKVVIRMYILLASLDTVLMEPSDSVGDRALPTQVFVDGDMTIEKCTAKCLAQGFHYAGLEYAYVCVIYARSRKYRSRF